MPCANFKVALRLQEQSFNQAEWLAQPDAIYTSYLNFYGLKFEQHLTKYGWLDIKNTRLWVQAFQPLQPTQGTFVHLHGYYDHSASYPSLQHWALTQNLTYVTFDLPGHGLSSGERASINSFTEYQVALSKLVEILQQQNLPKPWILSGFSTGGGIALDYKLQNSSFDSLVLFAPLIRPKGWHPKMKHLITALNWCCKSIPRKFSFNSGNSSYLNFAHHKDCLQDKYLSITWIKAMTAWIPTLEQAQPKNLTVLLVQGDLDSTLAWQHNTKLLCQLCPQTVKVIIAGARHQLLNESDALQQTIFKHLTTWMQQQT